MKERKEQDEEREGLDEGARAGIHSPVHTALDLVLQIANWSSFCDALPVFVEWSIFM